VHNCFAPEESSGHWAACQEGAFPNHLHVNVVRHSVNLKDSTLGISYLSFDDTPSQADVFYEGIEKLHQQTSVQPAIILGHVVAHEIGHLLLGINSRERNGVHRRTQNKRSVAPTKQFSVS